MHNDNQHELMFKQAYDNLFDEFKVKLLDEYRLVQSNYMKTFKDNFMRNLEEKVDNIETFKEKIEEKKAEVRDCEREENQLQSCL